ncbi:MAG TPA: flagellar biosynthesis protein FlhF [Pyrinomonadaceae bacterium]|nr:flagellar biosynthesis protein FlhF [Pyrinomonadaceae bacterium]
MKVKRYRASTMREALEKVKVELGDEALVLGSRQIQNKGFLGLGAKNFVEVSVSAPSPAPAPPEPAPTRKEKPAPSKSSFTSLGLQEISAPTTRNSSAAFSALAARAYSSANPAKKASTSQTATVLERAKSREVEAVNNSTPEKSTPEKSTLETSMSEKLSTSPLKNDTPKSPTSPKREPLALEIDRLHAEIREMKFTLGNFASNGNDSSKDNAHSDLDHTDARIYDSPFYETYLHLSALGVAPRIAKAATQAALESLSESREPQQLAQIGLTNALPELLTFAGDPLSRNVAGSQNVMALVGPTGVGKTTTVAKLAARTALREHRRVELITLDTYRIAAVDQLRVYAEIIGAGFHVPRSVLELDALVRNLSREATVLIDTIGRSSRDLADQMELADYLRNNDEIRKCLLVQATMHPADAKVAISKFALYGIDNLVITKIDETSRPGAIVTTAVEAGLPLTYVCHGQRVPEDIELASAPVLARWSHALAAARAAA